jgi:hypothetical protein
MFCDVLGIVTVLKMWKKDPNRRKKDYPCTAWKDCDEPLSWREVERMKDDLKGRNLEGYYRTFPEDRH